MDKRAGRKAREKKSTIHSKGQAALEFITTHPSAHHRTSSMGFARSANSARRKRGRALGQASTLRTASHETAQLSPMYSNRKAQAALEFITTYGWAFVIILTAIAALSYFGVLRPPIADRCIIGPEFVCQDYQLLSIDKAEAQFILANSKDFNMQIWNVNCTFPNQQFNDDTSYEVYKLDDTPQANNWEPGERRRVTCNLPDGEFGGFLKGDKAKLRFTITYTNQDIDGFNHTIDGEIVTEVQS
ncbi:MAG: hypothetical protein ABIJ21_00375 [Nanoarchaeota archaeon]